MSKAILWFRQDLRLQDNPALHAALQHRQVIPIYIHDPASASPWQAGSAARWWLHHSLVALAEGLARRGSQLQVFHGDTQTILAELCRCSGAAQIHWNRRYEPAGIALDKQLKHQLQQQGVVTHSHNAALLFEPWQVLKGDGEPYRVFTPFWKACLRSGLSRPLLDAPAQLPAAESYSTLSVGALQLLPTLPWADGFHRHWTPGEAGAKAALERFIEQGLPHYAEGRDRPDRPHTACLSPHLHLGEISPARLVAAIQAASDRSGLLRHGESWLRELGWREFAHYLLYHFPETTAAPFNPRFANFPWRNDPAALSAWQRGETGFPIIDAGMRELWHTGWMHNRVRMIVASLLTKNLLIPWQQGANWFWDTLVDADLAANTLGWQWTAGCGADAAPWFRIFNPVLQGQKFDPDGAYVRRWVPELAALPNKHLHQPWKLNESKLAEYGVVLGKDYPHPIVDLATSRERALAAVKR